MASINNPASVPASALGNITHYKGTLLPDLIEGSTYMPIDVVNWQGVDVETTDGDGYPRVDIERWGGYEVEDQGGDNMPIQVDVQKVRGYEIAQTAVDGAPIQADVRQWNGTAPDDLESGRVPASALYALTSSAINRPSAGTSVNIPTGGSATLTLTSAWGADELILSLQLLGVAGGSYNNKGVQMVLQDEVNSTWTDRYVWNQLLHNPGNDYWHLPPNYPPVPIAHLSGYTASRVSIQMPDQTLWTQGNIALQTCDKDDLTPIS